MRKLSLFLIIPGLVLALAPQHINPVLNQEGNKILGEVTNEPAGGWMIWWTSGGNVADFTISNCMQTSYIERRSQYDGFYEYIPIELTNDMRGTGKILEYPAGSGQYYNYTAGFWFGALYPREINGSDTTWFPSVSEGGPYSDFGAMAVPEMANAGSLGSLAYYGLNFSNARIPEGYQGEGDRLFAPQGEAPKPYQMLWPFADTMLNDKRSGDKLDPAQGDQVSHEGTYAVGGDWIPADQAACLWIRDTILPWGDTLDSYNVHGLGIRVEQRSYAWTSGDLANSIVFNYKIRNMNDYPLKAPYFGYFMDNDIGTNMDDLVGYDAGRDLAYTYDDNGSEPGWSTPPGYAGVAILETPGDVGLSGFVAWENDTLSHTDTTLYTYFDGYGIDSIQYAYMSSAPFTPWTTPTDVRMLPCSGPYPTMKPDDEYDITMAIVMGDDLAELQANVDALNTAFTQGFPWVGIDEFEPSLPLELKLTTTNITSGLVTLSYSLPSSSTLELSVYDASGRRVETLMQSHQSSGLHEVTWDASCVASGVYFVRLSASGKSASERVVILK